MRRLKYLKSLKSFIIKHTASYNLTILAKTLIVPARLQTLNSEKENKRKHDTFNAEKIALKTGYQIEENLE